MPAKRMLTAVMALLLAVSFAAPSGARADSDAGFEYTVADGVATVTGCTNTCPTTLVIPGTLGGYSVTSIGDDAFLFNNLTTVTIPNSVTSIGLAAVSSNALTTVTIPNSVTSVGNGAFSSNRLANVTIGSSVTGIGQAAFLYNVLTTVTIPKSVTSIGTLAFGENRLTSVMFLGNAPNPSIEVFGDVSSIGSNSGLTAVTRAATATGWGASWGGKPVVIAELPSTNHDSAPWLIELLLLASLVAGVGLRRRQRELHRN